MQVDINTYAGIDEVGRGPLAGPVVAAAVVLGDTHEWLGLKDSKVLTAKRREACAAEIKKNALAWAIGRCEPEEIDKYNIFYASLLAMKRAFEGISLVPELALVDGKYSPELTVQSYAVIKGDQHVPAISAASILAKVTRDLEMCELDMSYPQYGFAKHKGYPTALHMEALKQHGPCSHHRRSFKPVANVLK
ncbi:MAG: ribonuclease HII [Gammaproteobacteria bacterium]